MEYSYPFRVGITGHKSLTEVEKTYVSKEIERALVNIQRNIEQKKKDAKAECAFFISGVTCLNEGADRVFAREILKLPGNLEVVLPFKRELYMQDFWGDESKNEFLDFMNFDSYPMIVDSSDKPHKSLAYYNATKCVIDQCDVLIAVWDETPVKQTTGGTENMIKYAGECGVPVVTLYPRPNKESDKENKENLDGLSIAKYLLFAKEKKTLKKQPIGGDHVTIAALKTYARDADIVIFKKLLGELGLWEAQLAQAERRYKTNTRAIYILASLAAVLAVFAYGFKHIHSALFEDAGWPLMQIESVILLIILIISLSLPSIARARQQAITAPWPEKVRLEILKLMVLTSSNETLDQNYGKNIFQSRANLSRVFMIMIKEAWQNYKNTIPFENRVGLFKGHVIKEEINRRRFSLKNNKNSEASLGKISTAMFTIAVLALLALLPIEAFSNHQYYSPAMHALEELLQFTGFIFPLLGLIAEGWYRLWQTEKRKNVNNEQLTALEEVDRHIPELCSTEDELEYLFKKTESAILM